MGESTRVQPAAVVGPDLGELYRKAPDARKAELRKKIDQWVASLVAAGKADQLDACRRCTAASCPKTSVCGDRSRKHFSPESDRAEIVRQLTHLVTRGIPLPPAMPRRAWHD